MEVINNNNNSPIEQLLEVQYSTKSNGEYIIEMPAEQWVSFIKSFGELAQKGAIDKQSKQAIQNAIAMPISNNKTVDSALQNLIKKLEVLEAFKSDMKQALKETKMIMSGELEMVTLEDCLNEL